MSDGSPLPVEQPIRPLRAEERELLQALLASVWPTSEIDKRLTGASVQQMLDGGMGSVRFIGPEERRFEREVAGADYIDEDGIPVDITVNLDQQGDLFEIDFWKVNFSPLLRYPKQKYLKLRDLAPNSMQSSVAS